MTVPAAFGPAQPGPAAREPLRARRLGLDTQDEAVAVMRQDCPVCRAEGFTAHSRVALEANGRTAFATLYPIASDLLAPGEVGLSEAAWNHLALADGAAVTVRHPPPLESLAHVRAKIYGQVLPEPALRAVMADIVAGRYDSIALAAFVTAVATRPLDTGETIALTRAMVAVGDRLSWPQPVIVDKHCVGGLPGNRTTPLVVAICAAAGLVMPKTSSRAITSPAGTADAMETIAPVDLGLDRMRQVVEREGGCVVWGGAVGLSPADDRLIRVERALDLDNEAQLIASVMSKKVAAGATHLVLDIPVGPTAKVRGAEAAARLEGALLAVAEAFGMRAAVVLSDGTQPVGRGIGPAPEARDVLAVLRGEPGAPADLRERAVGLAGTLLELGGACLPGGGAALAGRLLAEGRAWDRFQRICEAQGGMRVPPLAPWRRDILAQRGGRVAAIDNRRLAKAAKLAGAPAARAAGLELAVRLGDCVAPGQPLFALHAESPGELDYARAYLAANPDIIHVEEA